MGKRLRLGMKVRALFTFPYQSMSSCLEGDKRLGRTRLQGMHIDLSPHPPFPPFTHPPLKHPPTSFLTFTMTKSGPSHTHAPTLTSPSQSRNHIDLSPHPPFSALYTPTAKHLHTHPHTFLTFTMT